LTIARIFTYSASSPEISRKNAAKNMLIYLNTEQAADYLGIKERKLYELVANGAVPCSKVTGKWLFPRAALDRWIEAGLARPHGFDAVVPPPIIGGSHDPLLEWAVRRSGSGLALLCVGSEAGLARLAANEVAVAAIHLHAEPGSDDEDGNLAAVTAEHLLHDAVIIAFGRREQGLLLPPGNPRGIGSLKEAITARMRFARRQPGAGAELLLKWLLHRDALTTCDIADPSPVAATGDDLAFTIKAGEADCGVATRAVAQSKGLDFLPLAWEHFDLAMRRRTYFEPGMQALLALMRTDEFQRHAAALGGLDVADAGTVRLVR
jgi:putative molybdopterin biosynthesis protein